MKVFDVEGQELGTWCGDDTAQEYLDGEHLDGGCFDLVVKVDPAAVDGESRLIHLRLLGSLVVHNPVMCDFLPLVLGHFLAVNEVDGVGAVVPA